MAGAKEIRSKIASIKSTQKITKAMQMVAASKLRRAQERMLATRPYAEKIQNVISHLAHAHPEYHHPYLQEREARQGINPQTKQRINIAASKVPKFTAGNALKDQIK